MADETKPDVPIVKPKNKGGRPKGTDMQRTLSLEGRIKILSKIASNPNSKPADIISACNMITQLLNDKVKATQEGMAVTQISFNELENTTSKQEIKPVENILKPVPVQPVIEVKPISEVLTDIVQPVNNKVVIEEIDELTFNFEQGKEDDN